MSDLLRLYGLGANAMFAQHKRLATSGNNIANAATPGHSRQVVQLQSLGGNGLGSGGVFAGSAMRVSDPLLTLRERQADAAFGFHSEASRALATTEAELLTSSRNLPATISDFFAALSRVTASPSDEILRRAFIEEGVALTRAFGSISAGYDAMQLDADQRSRELVSEVNRWTSELAAANRAMSGAGSPDPAVADRRDLAARNLAELVGGRARVDADGMMRVVLPTGQALVDGHRALQMRMSGGGASGQPPTFELVDGLRVDAMPLPTEGRLGGLLDFRMSTLDGARVELDALAYDFATQFNQVHNAHAGLEDLVPRDFFVQPGQAQGAAAGMQVSAEIVSDHRNLASRSGALGPGDNSGLLALSALAEQPLAAGGTRPFTAEAIRMMSDLGAEVAGSRMQEGIAAERRHVLAGFRDAVSGVSLEEETFLLSEAQRVAEAAMRFVSVVDDLLGHLIRTL
mgnify:CR=1 FL=1